MRITHLLLASTALAIVAAPVLADDNFANLDQSGDGNSDLVTQGPGDGNRAGTGDLAVTQSGDSNILTILQSGGGNDVGTEGLGFLQESNRNSAAITQSSSGNRVGEVTQTGISSDAGGVALRRNVLTIVQEEGDGNRVGVVEQTRSSAWWSTLFAANSATVTQSGADNDIGTLIQSGFSQSATVTDDGNDNGIERIEQQGLRNIASIAITGDGNGRSGLDFSGIDGAWRGLTQGHIYQDNDRPGATFYPAHTLTLTINGDDTSFGFSQSGVGNTITGLVTDGDGNQLGVNQLGPDNFASIEIDGSDNRAFVDQALWPVNAGNETGLLVAGDGNGVGVLQAGGNNFANVTISGGDNLVNIAQSSLVPGNLADVVIDGDGNDVALTQSGNNMANIAIAGGSNLLDALQFGLGNTLELTIWGSGNSAPSSTFSDPALAKSLLTTPDLVPGRIVQVGAGNSISYDVGISEASDGNSFAFSQVGAGNEIVGSTNGSGNQVVIVQTGASNFTSFTQSGAGNIIGVSQ